VHELVHLIVPPHNTRFYAILDHVLPSWSDVRRELDARPVGTP
jgi:predicted metal-dependent hydrolase